MADTLSKEIRSKCMSRVHSTNTKIEVMVRKYLFSKGFRYRINDRRYVGHPDIVLPKYKTIVFIHGCFWHKHNCSHFSWPTTNVEYWHTKIMNNVNRDEKSQEKLKLDGWNVIVVWECQLTKDLFKETMENIISSITKNK